MNSDTLDSTAPRKRKRAARLNSVDSLKEWEEFLQDVRKFEIQYVDGKGKFSFAFVEGPLVRALQSGAWYDVLLQRIFMIYSLYGQGTAG